MKHTCFSILLSLLVVSSVAAEDFTVTTVQTAYGCEEPKDLLLIKNLGKADHNAGAELLRDQIKANVCEIIPSGFRAQILKTFGQLDEYQMIRLQIGERQLWFFSFDVAGGPPGSVQ